MVYRVCLIRAMVDEEKLSFAQVARHMGVSRQMVARLYHYEESPHSGEGVASTMGALDVT